MKCTYQIHLPPASSPANAKSPVVIQYCYASVSHDSCGYCNFHVATCDHKQIVVKASTEQKDTTVTYLYVYTHECIVHIYKMKY